MMNRMVGSVLTLVTLLFSAGVAGGQTYTQMQWGMNKATTPYQFGANINGAWSNLGTVSSAGVWSIPSTNISGLGTAAFQNIGTSSATVPLLNGVNTWSGAQTFSAGATIPFTQSGAGAVASTVDDKLKQYINVLDYGADPTGTTPSQAAIQAALTANPGKTIYVPEGTYILEDMVSFPSNEGTSLVCDNPLRTIFKVPATFNMNALGVIRLTFGANDAIRNCNITFVQPDPTVAIFTGSMAQNAAPNIDGVLTVSAVTSGNIAVGDVVVYTGNQSAGTVITGQLSGTPGGVGTYSVNPGVTYASTTLRTARKSLLTQYPVAIYASGTVTRVWLENVKVNNSWRCLDATGNFGGSDIDNLDCGSYDGYEKIQFTGTISGTTLTVSAMASGSGAIRTNYPVYDTVRALPGGVRIVSQLSGTPGGVGTYSLSSSASLASPTTYRQATGGIAFDGSLDFIHISSMTCLPAGTATDTTDANITAARNAIYYEQSNACLTIGRIDGLTLVQAGIFANALIFTEAAKDTGGIPFKIENLQLDVSAGRLDVQSGAVQIDTIYSTRSSNALNPVINVSGVGTVVSVNNYMSRVDSSSRPCLIKASGGGVISFNSARFPSPHIASTSFVCVDGAVAGTGIEMSNAVFAISAVNRSAPVIDVTGSGYLRLTNSYFTPKGAVTGNGISLATDNVNNIIANNTFGGWPSKLPFATSDGYYDLPDAVAATITPKFAVNGDFVPANVVTTAWVKRSGDFADVSYSTSFDTNAFTTASGNFQLGLAGTADFNLPTPQAAAPCNLSRFSYVTTAALQVGAEIDTLGQMYFLTAASNAPSAGLGIINVVPSKVGVAFTGSCHYRVR